MEETTTTAADPFADHLGPIEALVDKKRKEPVEQRPPRSIGPSSLGDCDRLFYYRWSGTPVDSDLDTYGEFKRARAIIAGSFEEMVLGWFDHAKLLVERQVPYKNEEFGISGRADGKIRFGDRETILEIKSANLNGFSWSVRDPKEGHLLQLTAYLWMAGYTHGGYLAYATQSERGKIVWKLVYVPFLPERVAKIKEIAERRQFAMAMKILPDRPTEDPLQYWQCGFDPDGNAYCPMRRTCWAGTRWEIPVRKD